MIARTYIAVLWQAKGKLGKWLEQKRFARLHRFLMQGSRYSYATRKTDAVTVALQAHVKSKVSLAGSSWLSRAKGLAPAGAAPAAGESTTADSFAKGGSLKRQATGYLRDKYAGEAADRRRQMTRVRTKEGHDLTAAIRQRAVLAREGKPHVRRDRKRGLYLQKVRMSRESIVLRHWPIGKGFIAHLPQSGGSGVIAVEPGRPPYLFMKAWSIKLDGSSGFVFVKYDVRDSGFQIARDDVVMYPDDANRDLLVWEQKKLLGAFDLSRAANVASKANALKAKLLQQGEITQDESTTKSSQPPPQPPAVPAGAGVGVCESAGGGEGWGGGGSLLERMKAKGLVTRAGGGGSAAGGEGVGGGSTLLESLKAKGLMARPASGSEADADAGRVAGSSDRDDEKAELKETDALEDEPPSRSVTAEPEVSDPSPAMVRSQVPPLSLEADAAAPGTAEAAPAAAPVPAEAAHHGCRSMWL